MTHFIKVQKDRYYAHIYQETDKGRVCKICDLPLSEVWDGTRFLSCYPPKQSAATEMYEALKEWLAFDESVMECKSCQSLQRCSTHPAQLKMIIEMRNKAMLKAEGREV